MNVDKIACNNVLSQGQLFSLEGILPDFLNSDRFSVFPGFCDVHVHFREPGSSYKETIATGCASAAAGGYTAVATMPNLKPVPDSLENLRQQLEPIARDGSIAVLPYGSITKGEQGQELADMEDIAPYVLGFSDDGRGVQDREMMARAMSRAKALGKPIVAHCEDMSLILKGGCVHRGIFARTHGLVGINSESEYKQLERDLELVAEIGCKYHVCHISTKESVELIRQAKAKGLDVSCETAPHYLLLDEGQMLDEGRFKMNPPLRTAEDRKALVAGLVDGTIDMIATDHAPHSAEEKAGGLKHSLFGVVGLETAFPLLYTGLVLPGTISLEKLIDLMALAPRRRFGIPFGNDFSVWDLNESYEIDPEDFNSIGRATPFQGQQVLGRCWMTVYKGKPVYQRELDI